MEGGQGGPASLAVQHDYPAVATSLAVLSQPCEPHSNIEDSLRAMGYAS